MWRWTIPMVAAALLPIAKGVPRDADRIRGGLTEKPTTYQLPPSIGSVRLNLDPERYRSSSQGPPMKEEELKLGIDVSVDDAVGEIDRVIDRVVRTHGWSPVIPQYARDRSWAWHQWRGTIIERLWKSVLWNMLVPTLLIVGAKLIDPTTSVWIMPEESKHRIAAPLLAVTHGWNYLLTLTTFVTTFFVGHSHTFWRKSYGLARVVQGRMNDLGLLCAVHARRNEANGAVDAEAHAVLLDVARYLRLSHILFWADTCYRRTVDHGASVRVLLSRLGLDRLMQRGMLTQREHATLLAAQLPPARWYLVCLEWAISRITHARKEGVLGGGPGFEQVYLEKACELRGACMGIPDELAARMPLAYVHFTHCLVDMLLFLTPYALYPRLGLFSVPMTGVIALFYRGLVELSKSFLDPFGNRRVSLSGLSADIGISTLIGETNAGSLVWPQGVQQLPFDVASAVAAGPPSAAADAPSMRDFEHHRP